MTDKRIDAHTNTTTVADVDEFIVDSGSNGTRNITYSNLKSQILGSTSIATIGNSVTEAIYNTYTDIGDLTQTGVTGATVAAQISQLNAEIDNLIKTEYITANISTMSGNSDTTVTITFNPPSGYKAIGVGEVLTSSGAVAVTGFYTQQNSNVKVNCANLYSTAVSNVTVGVTVIYVRT